ncbi:MAG: PilZ domain-containing protein [Candidatus Aureabacteria bacterium]|nr:PilZ domain-containing protein [Candidatus Auribacterota bacterium]
MISENNNFEIIDRRHSPRFRVDYLANISSSFENIFATVIDISENGIGIILPKEFYVGDQINVSISSDLYQEKKPDLIKFNINMETEIVWIKKDDDKNMFRAGLKIISMEKEDLKKLRDHVNNLVDESLIKDQ